jgi:nitroreductase
MELTDVLKRRKMVRSFTSERVSDEHLARLTEAVLHAPSAGFTQGNEFLVLDDPAAVDAFYRITDHPDFPATPDDLATAAPLVIVPLANQSAYTERYSQPDKIQFGLDDPANWPVPFWTTDAAMAAMLILLVAIDCGLGALYAGIAHGEREVLAHFGVPDRFRSAGVVFIGHPADVDPKAPRSSVVRRRRRPLDELVHRNGW